MKKEHLALQPPGSGASPERLFPPKIQPGLRAKLGVVFFFKVNGPPLPVPPRAGGAPSSPVLTHEGAEGAESQQRLQQDPEAPQQRSAAAAVRRPGGGHGAAGSGRAGPG